MLMISYKKMKLHTLLFTLFFSISALACDCDENENFAESVEALRQNPRALATLVQATVLSHDEQGRPLIQIEDEFLNATAQTQMKVANGYGTDCVLPGEYLVDGKSYILLLTKEPWGAHKEYGLSTCSQSYLKVQDYEGKPSVFGKIEAGKRSNGVTEIYELDYFREWVRKKLQ